MRSVRANHARAGAGQTRDFTIPGFSLGIVPSSHHALRLGKHHYHRVLVILTHCVFIATSPRPSVFPIRCYRLWDEALRQEQLPKPAREGGLGQDRMRLMHLRHMPPLVWRSQ
jgi:hypothetical protein